MHPLDQEQAAPPTCYASVADRPPVSSAQGQSDAKKIVPFSIYFCIFGLLFTCYAYVHQDYGGGTSISRLDLLHALVRHGTFAIDPYYGNTSDRASFAGHYYSDKAPGAVSAALPAFALAEVLNPLGPEESDRRDNLGWGGTWLFSSWVATAGSLGLLTALGGAFFFAWICRWVEPKTALVATMALFLGAMPFTYATVLFSHGMVVGLLAIALWAVGKRGAVDTDHGLEHTQVAAMKPVVSHWLKNSRWDLLAGFCCGWVLASEFSAGPIVAGIFAWVLVLDWRRVVRLSLGALPPLLLIPAYSLACFGTPWTIGYAHHSTFAQMHQGLCGIQWPNHVVGWKYLFSPERGLFFWSPWFLMAVPGWVVLWRRERALFWLTLLAPVVLTVVMSGYSWDWRAGWTLGPRYLCPMLPLIALPAALGTQRFPRIGLSLAALSILLTGLGTLINATPRYEINNPLTQLHIPTLIKGELTHNLGQLCGLPGVLSLVPLFVVVSGYLYYIYRELPHPYCNALRK